MRWYANSWLIVLGVAVLLLTQITLADEVKSAVERMKKRCPDSNWTHLVERFDNALAEMKTPVENLVLPLDYHDNGRVRATIRAEKAQMLADGILIAEKIKLEMFRDNGSVEGSLTADSCIYDRTRKLGYSPGKAFMVRDSDSLSGRKLYFSTEEQYVKIMAECEVRTSRVLLNSGRLL